jgi:hypothetical protein
VVVILTTITVVKATEGLLKVVGTIPFFSLIYIELAK